MINDCETACTSIKMTQGAQILLPYRNSLAPDLQKILGKI